MKKNAIIIFSLIFLVILTLFFRLTPTLLIEKANDAQGEVRITASEAKGNFLTGYYFKNLKVLKSSGQELLMLDDLRVSLNFLPLIAGKIRIKADSEQLKGFVDAGFGGIREGEIFFSGITFDTDSLDIPRDISFSAKVSGKAYILNEKAEIEFKTEEIQWRKLYIAELNLPFDLLDRAKGGITAQGDKLIIKSIGFEGGRGYARLSGEINKGKTDMSLEILPKDWTEVYLLPLYQYKISPGVYKIPIN